MNIGEVAKELGLSIDTLCYYEKMGLIKKVNKVDGKRKYSDKDVKDLKFILCMKSAGLSLNDIKKFLEYYEQGDITLNLRINMLENQREILQREIKEKKETLDYLNYKIDLYEKRKGEKNEIDLLLFLYRKYKSISI